MRGLFTAGIIDVMMEARIEPDGLIGVSAGAAFGCNYKSRQIGRAIRYNKAFAHDSRFCSWQSLLKSGDLYNAEFGYHVIPTKYDVFDNAAYDANPMEFIAVCTDVETGKAVYKSLPKVTPTTYDWIRASASMPLVSRILLGLNCGRWDYIFSYIKTLKNYPDRVLPDRQAVTMDKPFLNAYSRLLIKTCHKRGAFAMGGMAAFIPSKDEEHNNQVLNKVKADKSLEANNGHDGTWIAHPGLADTAMAVFNDILGSRKNQLEVMREQDAPITADQLLAPCDGERTEEGMRANIRVAVQYIEAWISGNGCVPIYGLMEDAATAEISRTSIWQWIHHQKTLSNGKPVTKALFRQMLGEEMKVIASELGEERFSHGRFDDAARLMEQITTSDELIDFLTLPGYRLLA